MSTVETPTPSAAPPVITGENTQPRVEVPFVEPEEEPILPPPKAPKAPEIPPYEATPKETELSDLIKEITETSGLPGEKEAFRIKQEEEAGLETLRTSEADYTAQLTQLEADWKNVESKQQLKAIGRGITKAGLAPHTIAEQRRISIRANTVSALLAATQGKITFAQSQVDRAVNAKYAQAEADRQAKIENLELLSKDPTLTVEQQKRANAQVAALNKQAEFEAGKKADTTQIMNWAIELASQPTVAQQLMEIAQSEDPDLDTAFTLYSKNVPEKELKPLTAIEEVPNIENRLLASRGEVDGFVDPFVYQREKSRARMSPSQFDSRFGYLLSPKERVNLGIDEKIKGDVELTTINDPNEFYKNL